MDPPAQLYLEKTLEELDREEFGQAVEALAAAGSVYIHGKNASGSLAGLLMFRLRRLGIRVNLIPSGGTEIFEGLSQAKEGDLVVMFSFSKVSAEGKAILEWSREAGYRTLSFTSRRYVPDEERADLNLFIYRGEEQEYHSAAAPAAVLDALVLALSRRLGSGIRTKAGPAPKDEEKLPPGPVSGNKLISQKPVPARSAILIFLFPGLPGRQAHRPCGDLRFSGYPWPAGCCPGRTPCGCGIILPAC